MRGQQLSPKTTPNFHSDFQHLFFIASASLVHAGIIGTLRIYRGSTTILLLE
jgi:hypothetical protein